MLSVWIEWDLGQDRLVFTSQEKAIAWINKAIAESEGLSFEYPNGYIDCEADGYCGFLTLTIDPE